MSPKNSEILLQEMLRKRHTSEKVIHGDVATCVSESTAQLHDNLSPQILLNFFPWLSPCVNDPIYCIGQGYGENFAPLLFNQIE